jgi:hypothetical protein
MSGAQAAPRKTMTVVPINLEVRRHIVTIRNLSLSLALVLLMATALSAGIQNYGSDPNLNLGNVDTCSGCLFAYIQFPGSAAGQTVVSYQFYNGAAVGTTNQLTPILFEQTADRTFEILGIGASSSGFAPGPISVPFVLAQGSATVLDGSTFFGYVDGSANGVPNEGTISTNYEQAGQSGSPSYFHEPAGALSATESISGFYTFTDQPFPDQGDRTYSLQVSTTPEPGFYGLLSLGIGGLVVGLTRRRRRV